MNKTRLQKYATDQDFIARHNALSYDDQKKMLTRLNLTCMESLMQQVLPASIRLNSTPLNLAPMSEPAMLAKLRQIANKNKVFRSYIGQGYYNTHTPLVILRNVFENPGWYTAYTPYQPEISQGRLEGLLNFQHMVSDLTAMDICNASLLDEATAAAEAMTMAKRLSKSKSNCFLVSDKVHPQTLAVLKTRAQPLEFEIIIGDVAKLSNQTEFFGCLLQYPDTTGDFSDYADLIAHCQEKKALVCMATDLMALTLLKPPGEMNADIVIGSAQRFGVPMGFGGPHAAFLATRQKFARSLPGRIIGVAKDKREKTALRMALQTREQHIRREKATSNICTAQALLANMAGFYAIYHGPCGLKKIATRIHMLTSKLSHILKNSNTPSNNSNTFDTLTLSLDESHITEIHQQTEAQQINLRKISHTTLGISLDETTTEEDIKQLAMIILSVTSGKSEQLLSEIIDQQLQTPCEPLIHPNCQRTSSYLTHEVFNRYHSETAMLRYLKKLENKDLSLTHAMIPLGSCTMKLNATAEMVPIGWNEFSNIHPFVPDTQTVGYQILTQDLENYLAALTGYDAVSLQPNSGAQGEYAGILAIQAYHHSQGEVQRKICLIPQSAHGTNPASAALAGLDVKIVKCDSNGNIDLPDLKEKVHLYKDILSCIMITYPSTHGVFESSVREVCDIIHKNGGQVYLDGANLNAQVGLTSPGFIGADVSHLNLHKTFAIPHGGGGPGMGPIGVKLHLKNFLPGHPHTAEQSSIGAVSAAPLGSASILPISWSYITLLGSTGLKQATQSAILSANYIASRLAESFSILYSGESGRVAHECIVDLRLFKTKYGISEEDVAKRLMDYGFHAPTMSFPVAGTLMIEPTESEPLEEIDRFCDAMIAIRKEIDQIGTTWPFDDNPLVNAPHTLADITDDQWQRPYTRELAVFPRPGQSETKFWPTVNRINQAYGDRNLFCSCPTLT